MVKSWNELYFSTSIDEHELSNNDDIFLNPKSILSKRYLVQRVINTACVRISHSPFMDGWSLSISAFESTIVHLWTGVNMFLPSNQLQSNNDGYHFQFLLSNQP